LNWKTLFPKLFGSPDALQINKGRLHMKTWLAWLIGAAGVGTGLWRVRESRRDEKAFRDLLRGLTFGPNPQEVLQRIAERARQLVGGTAAYVERIDFERDEIVAAAVVHGHGLPTIGTRGPYKGSAAEQAIRTHKAILLGDVGRESRSILASMEHHVPAVVLPLITDSTAIGALIVLQGNRRINKHAIDRLQTMADMSAISLRRAFMLDQLERSLHVREELQRILAHDLRNPINTIVMAVSSLRHIEGLTEREDHLLQMIQRSTMRMNRLIQDLIDNAVIERHGELPINPKEQLTQNLAEEVCQLTRIQAKAKTVYVHCDIQGNATVWVDRDRLLQVLTNLIDNAIKFTPQGGTVTVRSEVAQNEVRFSVSDTGPGIPESDRERIFEPYWQAPATAHLGAGLGLAIAKQIVQQHGGRIWVESADGNGSKFVFTIPAAKN
jgi:signal transduction histidine kinase